MLAMLYLKNTVKKCPLCCFAVALLSAIIVELQNEHFESDIAMLVVKYLKPVRIKRRFVLTDVTIYDFAHSRMRLSPRRGTKRFNNVPRIVKFEQGVPKTNNNFGITQQKRKKFVLQETKEKSWDRKTVEYEGDFIQVENTDELTNSLVTAGSLMTNLPGVRRKRKKKAKKKKDSTKKRTSNKMTSACSSKTPNSQIKDKLGHQKLEQQQTNVINGVVKTSIVQQTTNIASVKKKMKKKKKQNVNELNNNKDLRINSMCSSEQLLENNKLWQEKLWKEQMERNYSTIKYECGSVCQEIVNLAVVPVAVVPVEEVLVEVVPVAKKKKKKKPVKKSAQQSQEFHQQTYCYTDKSIYRKFRHVEKREWTNFECHLVLTSVLKQKGCFGYR